MSKPKRKPPPETPGNTAGRRLLARERAWLAACGGVRIVLGAADSYEGIKRYAPPEDIEEKFKKLLAAPKPKKPKPKSKGKVDFFSFSKNS